MSRHGGSIQAKINPPKRMRFGNLIFGVALLLVAVTLALTITFRNDPEGASAERLQTAATSPARSIGNAPPRGSAIAPVGRRNPARSPREKLPDVNDLDVVMDNGPATRSLTPAQRQDIAKRVPWVQQDALSRLGKMTERLDLTPIQQHKVFPQLLRATTGYHPAMIINYPAGTSIPSEELADNEKSPDEAIHDSLDPDQQEDFLQQKLDDQAWWEEIVAQLEEDFDASVASNNGPVAAGQAPPGQEAAAEPQPEPQPQQGINLFDLLNE